MIYVDPNGNINVGFEGYSVGIGFHSAFSTQGWETEDLTFSISPTLVGGTINITSDDIENSKDLEKVGFLSFFGCLLNDEDKIVGIYAGGKLALPGKTVSLEDAIKELSKALQNFLTMSLAAKLIQHQMIMTRWVTTGKLQIPLLRMDRNTMVKVML